MPTLITVVIFVFFILFSYFIGNALLGSFDENFDMQVGNTFFGMLIILTTLLVFIVIWGISSYVFYGIQI